MMSPSLPLDLVLRILQRYPYFMVRLVTGKFSLYTQLLSESVQRGFGLKLTIMTLIAGEDDIQFEPRTEEPFALKLCARPARIKTRRRETTEGSVRS